MGSIGASTVPPLSLTNCLMTRTCGRQRTTVDRKSQQCLSQSFSFTSFITSHYGYSVSSKDLQKNVFKPLSSSMRTFQRQSSSEASQENTKEIVSIKVPQMGESIKEGTLISWQVSVGDFVEMDQVIAQIETDKVTVEVRAPESGVINEQLVQAASESTKQQSSETQATTSTTQTSGAPVSIKVPEMGESIKEGTLISWTQSEGDYVEMDQVIAQVETDKVTVEIRAPQNGILKNFRAKEGDTVKVGIDIAELEPTLEAPKNSSVAETKQHRKETTIESQTSTFSSSASQPSSPPPPPPPEVSSSSVVEPKGGEKRVALTRMRRRIAERLKAAQNTAAMLTTFNEVDMSALMELRSQYKDAFEKKHGIRLGFMSAFTKAATIALIEQPEVNAYIDGEEIVYHDYVDISVAVSAPTGLVVPVVRNCERLSFAQIEKTIHELGESARKGKLTIQDMQGGTFTISNGGVFGSLISTPILNMPQSAILGMHAIQKRPVVVNDQIIIRPMMYLALSYDHRLVDGREAVTFLRRIKSLVEDPRKMLLDIDI
eukprot:jgi/Galph1/563/GphlegSOOS_G5325.1